MNLLKSVCHTSILLILISAASNLRADDESQDEIAALKRQLARLQSERVETAHTAAEANQAAYESGTITLDVLLNSIDKLADARLAIAKTSAERVQAHEERLTWTRQIEQKVGALNRTGSRGGEVTNFTMAKRARQSAEIALLREKLKEAERIQSTR